VITIPDLLDAELLQVVFLDQVPELKFLDLLRLEL
jgi:hypothetical protein